MNTVVNIPSSSDKIKKVAKGEMVQSQTNLFGTRHARTPSAEEQRALLGYLALGTVRLKICASFFFFIFVCLFCFCCCCSFCFSVCFSLLVFGLASRIQPRAECSTAYAH